MAESPSRDLIGEATDAMCKLAGMPEAFRRMQNEQTVVIYMLQTRGAEIDLMRSLEQPSTDRTWYGPPEMA